MTTTPEPDLDAIYQVCRHRMEAESARLLGGRMRSAGGESADDIVQNVIIEVFLAARRNPRLRTSTPAEVVSWLLARTRWRTIDAIRRSGRSQSVAQPEELRAPGASTNVEDVVINRDQLKRSERHYRCLTFNQRFVLIERLAKCRPAIEVAQDLGVEPPRVAQLQHAAIKRLRECLRREECREHD